jgi:hypothetical protein
MKEIKLNAISNGTRLLPLGRQGENEALKIIFDVSRLIAEYGEGVAVVTHMRSKDTAPYVKVTERDGVNVTWNINDTDTLFDGSGKANLMWNVNGVTVKTIDFDTYVFPSISGIVTVPDALQSWYNEMLEYINSVAVDDSKIEDIVIEYLEEHPIEAPVTSVNSKTGAVNLTSADVGALSESELDTAINTALAQAVASGDFKGEKGDKGDKGDQGIQGIQGIQGEKGDTGAKGEKGDTGATGAQGEQGLKGDKGDKGDTGTNGQDGYSPVVTVTQTITGHTVSITDKTSTQTFDVLNGVNGTNGQNGADGQDLIHMGETVTASGVVTKELTPNVFCLFSDTTTGISDLTLTLASGNYYDEYMCAFTTSASGCNLSLPNTVSYIGSAPTLEANTYYELSIVNNKAVIA